MLINITDHIVWLAYEILLRTSQAVYGVSIQNVCQHLTTFCVTDSASWRHTTFCFVGVCVWEFNLNSQYNVSSWISDTCISGWPNLNDNTHHLRVYTFLTYFHWTTYNILEGIAGPTKTKFGEKHWFQPAMIHICERRTNYVKGVAGPTQTNLARSIGFNPLWFTTASCMLDKHCTPKLTHSVPQAQLKKTKHFILWQWQVQHKCNSRTTHVQHKCNTHTIIAL